MKRIVCLLRFSAFLTLFAATGAVAEEPEEEAGYAGNQSCADCHDDLAEPFARTAHGLAAPGRVYGPRAGECESCHGPSAAHVRSRGKKVTPRPLKGASAEELSEACLDCHAGNPNQLRWLDHGGYGCASCHSVHAAPPTAPSLLAEGSVTATCLGCHADLRRSLTQRSRHPLAEGKMDCASCHDPHGTGTAEHMVRADSNTELCVGCHANKRGPHLWEHAPVRENCLNCHAPHGSNHEGLLVTQTARLCQQCHMQGRHQTVAGMPNEPWIFNRSCLNCHPMIHGSNHPSGVIFQR